MLRDVLRKVAASGVRLFRVSSAMFPLSDRVPRRLWDNDALRGELALCGEVARKCGIRLTTHPGQFCVLSSDSDSVVEKAIVELEHHAWMFDSMGMPRSPYAAINVHGGKADRQTRLIDAIRSLPEASRSRLTLENCETCYSLVDLLPVSMETGVPIVWDSHHHVFNDGGLDGAEAADAADETWPKGVKPLQHISNTEPGMEGGSFTERRKHSDMIHYIPAVQLERLRRDAVDLEVEAKMKNLAVLEMPKKFDVPL
jgi:UV DNA damage endonuclease